MKGSRSRYYGHRFPPGIISFAVWLYHRFCLSFRDVEDLLAERGIIVSYETIRIWCRKFGPGYDRKLKGRQGRLGDSWHLDEVFIRINGQQHYLWRAVDQDGDVIDILVQPRRDQSAAERFFRRLVLWFGTTEGLLLLFRHQNDKHRASVHKAASRRRNAKEAKPRFQSAKSIALAPILCQFCPNCATRRSD